MKYSHRFALCVLCYPGLGVAIACSSSSSSSDMATSAQSSTDVPSSNAPQSSPANEGDGSGGAPFATPAESGTPNPSLPSAGPATSGPASMGPTPPTPGGAGNVEPMTGGTGGGLGGGSGGPAAGGDGAGGLVSGGAAGDSTTGGGAMGGAAAGGSNGGSAAFGGNSAAGMGNSTGGAGQAGAGGMSANPTVASDGCPLTLEGFATLNADGQDGTYGGLLGETVTVTNQADLNTYATAEEPYTIRVQGAITLSPKGTEIRVASNKTIIGVGTSGEIVEGGFFLAEGVHNVILRNLVIRDTFVEGDWEGKTQDFDGVQMDTVHHVWIDHCHLHHIGDGMIDSRKDTSYLTVSWSVLSDHNKAFGIGWTENVTAQMTIHHNWFRDLNQRNPSTDNVLRAHLYNNWMQRLDSYGNYARGGTNMVLENSVFEEVNNPYYYDTGSLVAIGNVVNNSPGQQEASGGDYSFFDPSDFYDYTLDPAAEVEELLSRCAGPHAELGL